jgi:hypothetical protein
MPKMQHLYSCYNSNLLQFQDLEFFEANLEGCLRVLAMYTIFSFGSDLTGTFVLNYDPVMGKAKTCTYDQVLKCIFYNLPLDGVFSSVYIRSPEQGEKPMRIPGSYTVDDWRSHNIEGFVDIHNLHDVVKNCGTETQHEFAKRIVVQELGEAFESCKVEWEGDQEYINDLKAKRELLHKPGFNLITSEPVCSSGCDPYTYSYGHPSYERKYNSLIFDFRYSNMSIELFNHKECKTCRISSDGVPEVLRENRRNREIKEGGRQWIVKFEHNIQPFNHAGTPPYCEQDPDILRHTVGERVIMDHIHILSTDDPLTFVTYWHPIKRL